MRSNSECSTSNKVKWGGGGGQSWNKMPVGEDCGGIKWPWREGWWNKLPLGRGDSDEIKYPWGEGWW